MFFIVFYCFLLHVKAFLLIQACKSSARSQMVRFRRAVAIAWFTKLRGRPALADSVQKLGLKIGSLLSFMWRILLVVSLFWGLNWPLISLWKPRRFCVFRATRCHSSPFLYPGRPQAQAPSPSPPSRFAFEISNLTNKKSFLSVILK